MRYKTIWLKADLTLREDVSIGETKVVTRLFSWVVVRLSYPQDCREKVGTQGKYISTVGYPDDFIVLKCLPLTKDS